MAANPPHKIAQSCSERRETVVDNHVSKMNDPQNTLQLLTLRPNCHLPPKMSRKAEGK